jgi:single-strand DNA-binding protein
VNKVILLGNLTRDVEVRYGQSGLAIGKSGLAVNRKTKTQSGEYKEEVMFIDFTVFGGAAETIPKYFRRGSKILLEGRLQFDQWTDQNGTKRSKHSIVVDSFYFPENKASANQNNNFNNNNYQQQPQQNNWNNNGNNYNSNNSSWNNQNNNTPSNRNTQNFEPQQQNQNEDKVPEIDINSDMDGNVPF